MNKEQNVEGLNVSPAIAKPMLPAVISSEPKYVAQGLLKTWKEEKALDTSTSKVAPLMYYLRFNYEERYVKLCKRLGVEPCGFGAWLRKPISSII